MKWLFLLLFSVSAAHAADTIYEFKVKDIDGKEVSLAEYKGKTAVIVNTASKCGYTPQYEGLEALYKKYKSRGVVVLGFPSNDFHAQEPGTNAEIKKFCQAKYNVDFPLFEKNPVSGSQKQPLYAYLTDHGPDKGEVKWNFEKFVVDPSGHVVARFRSKVKPDSNDISSAIEKTFVK